MITNVLPPFFRFTVYLQRKTNRKSYMAYQMAATAVTLKVIHRLNAFFKCNLSNISA